MSPDKNVWGVGDSPLPPKDDKTPAVNPAGKPYYDPDFLAAMKAKKDAGAPEQEPVLASEDAQPNFILVSEEAQGENEHEGQTHADVDAIIQQALNFAGEGGAENGETPEDIQVLQDILDGEMFEVMPESEDKIYFTEENLRQRYVASESTGQAKPGIGAPTTGAKPAKTAKERLSLPWAALMLVLCFGAGMLGSYFGNNGGKTVIYQAPDSSSATGTSVTGTKNFADVVEQVYDCVVEVVTENVSYTGFFGQSVTSGAGSGVIISEDGYIITNNHVVSGASTIKVTLANGKTYKATLVGTDAANDIAVIKIDASGLQSAVYGDSASIRVGDDAIAIGNPLGTLGGTVTNGIISALDRDVEIDGQVMTLMQTNAAVNPGNSGGGLFNMNGELIGIVNAKSSGDDIEGLGFAIPINVVKPVVEELIVNGRVTGRPALGITILDLTTVESAQQYGVDRLGVYVQSVNEGSGSHGKLEVGDYIFSIDEVPVQNSGEIASILAQHEVGDTVTVQVIRDKRTVSVSIVLTEMQ